MKKIKKGFTLVEVLIVVVIIAILASLIVPRMLAQTQKAKAAEAHQMVGAMVRALERYYDFNGSVPSAWLITEPVPGSRRDDWSPIGLSGIGNSNSWTYEYHNTSTSQFYVNAILWTGTAEDYNNYTSCSVDASNSTRTWTCVGVFKYQDSTDHTKGCTV